MRAKAVINFLIGFIFFFASPAHAWWATGHLITAQIAYNRLTPEVKAEANRLVSVLANTEPRYDHFVPASLWLDGLKERGIRDYDRWHYINFPYNPFHLPKIAEPSAPHALWAIEQALTTLKNKKSEDKEKAFMLRVLLHVVGDIHQPLHTVNRFTPEQSKGDRGGNGFPLKGQPDNLHAFWDSTAHLFPQVHADHWQTKIPELARQVVEVIPPHKLPMTTPEEWAKESYRLAVTVVYQGVKENTKPSKAYVQQAQSLIRQRLAQGGYRLGELLNQTLSISEHPK